MSSVSREAQKSSRNTSNDKTKGLACYLDLTLFKTEKCTLDASTNHNLKRCPKYHDETKDRRRKLGTYRSELCQNTNKAKKKFCTLSDACTFSHNTVEKFYHPEMYKAKFCESYTSGSRICEHGDYCAFAHNESEISIDLIEKFVRDADFYCFHFKTMWCPY